MAPGFFNTVMAGHISKEDLAGVAVGASIFFPFFGTFLGIISGLTPMIAHYYGEGRPEDIRLAVRQGLYWSTVLALLFILLGYCLIPVLLPKLELEPAVEAITLEYLSYIAWGFLPISWAAVLRNLIDSHGRTTLTMMITILIVPVNIGLNYVFMYGVWGVPALGGPGAGLGAAITFLVTWLLNMVAVLTVAEFKEYELFKHFVRPNIEHWVNDLKICLPIGATIFCEQSIFGAVGLFIATYGTTIMAAHHAAINFTTIVYMLPLAVSMSLTILVGYEVGSGRRESARAYIRLGRILTLAFVGTIAIMLYSLRDFIAGLYTPNAEVQAVLKPFLAYALVMQFADSVNAPLQGALRGYKDVTVTFILAVISFWLIGLPAGYFIANNTSLGAYGYWAGLNVGIVIGAILLMLRLRYVERIIK